MGADLFADETQFGTGAGEGQHLGIDEAVVADDIGLGEAAEGAQGQKIGSPRTGPDKADAAKGLCGGGVQAVMVGKEGHAASQRLGE